MKRNIKGNDVIIDALSLINKIITDNSHKMNITTNSYSGFKIEIVFNDKDISN